MTVLLLETCIWNKSKQKWKCDGMNYSPQGIYKSGGIIHQWILYPN